MNQDFYLSFGVNTNHVPTNLHKTISSRKLNKCINNIFFPELSTTLSYKKLIYLYFNPYEYSTLV